MRRLAALMLLSSAPLLGAQQVPDASSNGALVTYRISPVAADSTIRRFAEPNLVVFERNVKPSAPLLVFLPGTGGRPLNASVFVATAARQGYRAIGLEYNDTPAVAQICPRERDPQCSEKVRRKRIYGDDVTPLIDDDVNESIAHRLVALVRYLDREHPSEGWGQYVDGDAPAWSRIAVSGLSQGAGMAAFIAQHATVSRVLLFSSPWDNYGPAHTLAPWLLRGTRETPADRWFAVYHAREPTADLIRHAYAALAIPQDHVRLFTLDPAPNAPAGAFHPSVVSNGATPRAADGTPAYLDDWRWMLGDVH